MASQASTGQTTTVVSFAPSPRLAAAPASAASTGPPDSRKHAAITGNDAATRSFWAVDDSRTKSENVASRNAADADGRTP